MLEQGQLALGGNAFVRHHAEEFAGRNARVIDQGLKMFTGRKPLAEFP